MSVSTVVDSGNYWMSCISEKLLKALNLDSSDLEPLRGSPRVATAAEGSSLAVLGRVKKPLKLKLGGHPTIIRFRPVVIKDLAMSLNLSGPFMSRHKIDQIHSQGCLKFQNRLIPLLNDSKFSTDIELKESPLYTQKTITIAPLCQQVVPLIAPKLSKHQANEVVIEGSLKSELLPWRNVVMKSEGQHLMACVFNPTDEPIELRKGTHYGEAVITHNDINTESQRICVLDSQSDFSECGKNDKPTFKQLKDIITSFNFDKNPLLKDDNKLLLKAAKLMFKHRNIFTESGEIGKTDLLEFEVNLMPEAKAPIFCKNRPINPNLEKEIKEQIDTWLKHGIIEESNSPYNFPLVCVRKKNGKIRICQDFRKLNNVTIKDKFPITSIKSTLSRMKNAKVFSNIDGSGAFNCIPVRESDRDKLAFSALDKQFRFCRMPFGVTNGPPTYSRLMTRVLQNVPPSMALCYLDDVVIFTTDVESHIVALDKVFTAHAKAGLKLNAQKSSFFQSDVQYLGFKISSAGISPDPEACKIIRQWPLPKTVTELKTFIGKLSYFRTFIKDFAAKARPLTEMLKSNKVRNENGKSIKVPRQKAEPLQHNQSSIQAFHSLRDQLCKAPVLAHPDFSGKYRFILDTDFSTDSKTMGGVLSQDQPDGTERPIAYAAKKCTETQAAYDAYKGEMLALLTMLNHFKYYLLGNNLPFLVRVDNRALSHFKSMQPPSSMTVRWLEALSHYNFVVEHRLGTKHGNADNLSRIGHADTANAFVTEIAKDESYSIFSMSDHKVAHSLFSTPLSEMHLDIATISRMQKDDHDLCKVIEIVKEKRKPSNLELVQAGSTQKVYLRLISSLEVIDDLLVYKKPEKSLQGIQFRKVIVWPKELYNIVIKSAHLAVAHRAVDSTLTQAQKIAYFPTMRNVVEKVIRECKLCQTKIGTISNPRRVLIPTHSGIPFDKLSVDFVGPLPVSYNNNEYLLTLKCLFTKWVEAFPVKRANAETVVDILEKEIIPRFGLMSEIHTDRATSFLSDLLADVYLALGINCSTTPPYHPQSNPVERSHKDLNAALTALSQNDPRAWEKCLPQALFALRTSVNRSTGFTPYELVFGRDAQCQLDLLYRLPQPHPEYRAYEDYALEMRERMQRAFEWARANLGKSVKRQRSSYSGKLRTYAIGAQVWLFTPKYKAGQRRKFRSNKWTGPWTVQKKLNDVTYVVSPDPSWQRRGSEIVSWDRIKPYYPEEGGHHPPHINEDLAMEGDEFVEQLQEDIDEEDAVPLDIPETPSPFPNFEDLPPLPPSPNSSNDALGFYTPPTSPSASEAPQPQASSASEPSSHTTDANTSSSKPSSSKVASKPAAKARYSFVPNAPEIKDNVKQVRFNLPPKLILKKASSQKPPLPRPPQSQSSEVSANTRSKTKAKEKGTKDVSDSSTNSLKVKMKNSSPRTVRFKLSPSSIIKLKSDRDNSNAMWSPSPKPNNDNNNKTGKGSHK